MTVKYSFGVAGCGNMGSAILKGSLTSGPFKASDVAVFDLFEQKREECRSLGCAVLSSAAEVFASCKRVLLAVKPQSMDALLKELASLKKPYPLIICIVAGFPSAKIRAVLPGAHVVRVMPNTPLLLGCGATALCPCEGTTDKELEDAKALFDRLGETAVLRDENKMNDIIAVNGSSPAFVYYFIEALARWGESRGMSYGDCLRLCAKTFEGSAKMILRGDVPPAELIRRVCSPGGTTLAAMSVLEEKEADGALRAAADACTKRAIELSQL